MRELLDFLIGLAYLFGGAVAAIFLVLLYIRIVAWAVDRFMP